MRVYFTYSAKEAGIITQLELRRKISGSVKLLRAEYGYSQQETANAVGLSKKTLIQVEKGRLLLGWSATCAVCAVFRSSRFLQMELGEDPVNIVETLAHNNLSANENFENRNFVFWDVIEEGEKYSLSKNILTEHYRIAGRDGKKYFTSFDLAKITEQYNKLTGKGDNQ